jgi:hypothetical protein
VNSRETTGGLVRSSIMKQAGHTPREFLCIAVCDG